MLRKVGRVVAAVSGAAIAVGAAGCGTVTVSKSSLESRVKQDINNQGAAPASDPVVSVSCPSGLDGKTGASIQCTASQQSGNSQPIRITVTSVSGSTVNIKTDILGGGSGSGSSTDTTGGGSSTDTTGGGSSTDTTGQGQG